MKTKLSKKMVLKKETISHLSQESLDSIRGGVGTGLNTAWTLFTAGCTLKHLDTLCI
jgi:hypothetical protein